MLSTLIKGAFLSLALLSSSAFAKEGVIDVPAEVQREIVDFCKQYKSKKEMEVYCYDAQLYGYKDFGYLWAMHSEKDQTAKAIMLGCLDKLSDKGEKFPDYAMTMRCTVYFFNEKRISLNPDDIKIPDVPRSSREVIKLR